MVPLVVPLAVPPRVVPRVVPRLGAEYFDVGLEETVLGGCSTNEVSVVLREGRLENARLESTAIAPKLSQGISSSPITHKKVISPSSARGASFSASVYGC